MAPPDRLPVIRVNLGSRSHDIQVGRGLSDDLVASIAALGDVDSVFAVCDANTRRLADALARQLENASTAATIVEVPSGEAAKSLDSFGEAARSILGAPRTPTRSSVLLGVGGGAVGDLTGFLASTLMRGLRVIHVPTTLVAMLDSSIGGKNAINIAGAKNTIGTFWQPSAVWCDAEALQTLPEREWRSGLGEAAKYGLTLAPEVLELLPQLSRGSEAELNLIWACARAKAAIVEADEREESGLRAILNAGHTVGHGVEAACRGALLHGECVALGLVLEAEMCARRGVLDDHAHARVRDAIYAIGSPPAPESLDLGAVVQAASLDKKNRGGKLRVIAPTPPRSGAPVTLDLDRDSFAAALQEAWRATFG